MKRNAVTLAFLFVMSSAVAQLSLGDRLVGLCRVWGYLKYFHEGPSTCRVNWDSVLVANVSAAKSATDIVTYNQVLQNLFTAAGSMSIPATPAPVITPTNITNLNLGWFTDPIFTSTIQAQLDTVRKRFRPHNICNVTDNSNYVLTTQGWVYFNDEAAFSGTSVTFPDNARRLLVTFRYWNYISYFFNSIHLADVPWEQSLRHAALQVDTATSALSYHLSILQLIAAINDSHAASASSPVLEPFFGAYYPPFRCEWIENKVVVVGSSTASIQKGDVIVSLNGIPVDTLLNRRKKYIPASNARSLYRDLLYGNKNIFGGNYGSTVTIIAQTQMNPAASVTLSRTYPYTTLYNLGQTSGPEFRVMRETGCNVGYVHMGELLTADVNAMFDTIATCDAVVFDIRNYPNGTGWSIAPKLASAPFTFARLFVPSTTYPGILSYVYAGQFNGSIVPSFKGRVYILVNEKTQSQAEYTTMMLRLSTPMAKVIGSQSAGADGNVTSVHLPGGINSYFSTLGTYYPNGTCAQRAGVQIDHTVTPTIAGIRAGRDEVLYYVLDSLEQCVTTGAKRMATTPLALYPNPFESFLTVNDSEARVNTFVRVSNSLGAVVLETVLDQTGRIDTRTLAPGIYNIEILTARGTRHTTAIRQ